MDAIPLPEVARLVGGRVAGPPGVLVSGVAGLREAGPAEISFLARPDYAPLLAVTRAAAVLAPPGTVSPGVPLVLVDDPGAAFTILVERFTPPVSRPPAGVHPAAFVDPSADLGEGVSVGPRAVIEADARVGPRTVVRGGAYVGRGVRVGADAWLDPGALLLDGVTCGDRVRIGAGAAIGCDGFGFLPGRPPRRVPQSGTVVVGSDVDIGAGVTVARARFGATVIGDHVKIDCLVHVAHNVRIGDGTIVVAQSGIAGSARLGRGVVLAAQSGVAGHVEVGDGATLAGRAGVTRNVAAGATVAGFPAEDHRAWKRSVADARRRARWRRGPRARGDGA